MQAAEWIRLDRFLCEALKFGMQNPNSSAIAMASGALDYGVSSDLLQRANSDQILYQIYLVKSFAF